MDTQPDINRKIRLWYYLPAAGWLLAALLIGTWVRFEWHSPWQTWFAIPNLIHAHSHAALLGWVYLVFAGFTLRYFIKKKTASRVMVPMSAGLQLANLGMLISFALQGYAFWSILFSSLHLFLTLWLAVLFLLKPDRSESGLSRDFAAAAWLWHVLSGFGPFALAFTGGMAGTMAQFWLGSYLFLLLNGWIIFMMLSVWLRLTGNDRPAGKRERFGFNLMFITLLPALISMLYPLGITDRLIRIGFVFNILHGLGMLMLVPALMPSRSLPVQIRMILICAAVLFGLKAIIQPVSFMPDLIYLTGNHFLKVAFLHLVLLGLVTPVLTTVVFNALSRLGIQNIVLVSLMIGSALLTTLFLFWIPVSSMTGIYVYIPWQLIMGWLGVAFLAAIIWATCLEWKTR